MKDVDNIIEMVRSADAEIRCDHLRVVHPGADDDGLWVFVRSGIPDEVQIESATGECPFVIEHDTDDERRIGGTPDDVVATILEWLAVPGDGLS